MLCNRTQKTLILIIASRVNAVRNAYVHWLGILVTVSELYCFRHLANDSVFTLYSLRHRLFYCILSCIIMILE